MNLNGKLFLNSGFIFDYKYMLEPYGISLQSISDLSQQALWAHEAMQKIRNIGIAKAHYSKDGEPEHVYFTKLPFLDKNNPNSVESINALKEFSAKMKKDFNAIIFLGIGGSYLGNKVLFDAFAGDSWNTNAKLRKDYPRIYFSGNNLDVDQYAGILNEVVSMTDDNPNKTGKILLVPISKSGTTLETLTAFNYFYHEFSQNAQINFDVAVITDLDNMNSPLCKLAKEHNWDAFHIAEGIGGRFCVLSNPGLITAAAIGMDIQALLDGAKDMEIACQTEDIAQNPALLNACLKYLAAKQGKNIEIFMPYAAALKSLGEWYVQLLAESLGKRYDRDGNCVFYGRTPVAAIGSTDMHAQTQQHQDGKNDKVVQFIEITNRKQKINLFIPFKHIPELSKYDGLNVDDMLKIALEANAEALASDNRLNARIILPELNEYYLGQILYFLMLSIAYEGEIANVDAYDQPGVETYKKLIKEKMQTK